MNTVIFSSETTRLIALGFAGTGLGLMIGSAITGSDATFKIALGVSLMAIVLMLRAMMPA